MTMADKMSAGTHKRRRHVAEKLLFFMMGDKRGIRKALGVGRSRDLWDTLTTVEQIIVSWTVPNRAGSDIDWVRLKA